jgi:hypothetical protein
VTASIYYLNGQESALIKLGFMGFDPSAMKHIGLRAAGGAAAGAGIGAMAGGEDNRMSGALAGGAMGGLAAGGASMARKAPLAARQRSLDEGLAQLRDMGPFSETIATGVAAANPDIMRNIQAIRNNQHRIQQGITGSGMGKTMAGGAAMGAIPAMAAGRMTRDE